jgi:hypothetical protein
MRTALDDLLHERQPAPQFTPEDPVIGVPDPDQHSGLGRFQ